MDPGEINGCSYPYENARKKQKYPVFSVSDKISEINKKNLIGLALTKSYPMLNVSPIDCH
jgi:hypothetical protein